VAVHIPWDKFAAGDSWAVLAQHAQELGTTINY
jgi:L-rhamnose isomerase